MVSDAAQRNFMVAPTRIALPPSLYHFVSLSSQLDLDTPLRKWHMLPASVALSTLCRYSRYDHYPRLICNYVRASNRRSDNTCLSVHFCVEHGRPCGKAKLSWILSEVSLECCHCNSQHTEAEVRKANVEVKNTTDVSQF